MKKWAVLIYWGLLTLPLFAADLNVLAWDDYNGDGVPNELDSGWSRLPGATVYLLADTSDRIISGQEIQLDENGLGTFTNIADGSYRVLMFGQSGLTPTTITEFPISVTNGVVDSPWGPVEFGFLEDPRFGYSYYYECRTEQYSENALDGRAGQEYCDMVDHFRVEGSCCGSPEVLFTPVLWAGYSNLVFQWSTGSTNHFESLTQGFHSVVITDLDSGCVSSQSLYAATSPWQDRLAISPPAMVQTAQCGTNGIIRVTHPEEYLDAQTYSVSLEPGGRTSERFFSVTTLPRDVVQFTGLTAGTYQVEITIRGYNCPLNYEVIVPELQLSAPGQLWLDAAATNNLSSIDIGSNCTPVFASSAPWLSGSVDLQSTPFLYTINVSENTDTEPRTGTISVNGIETTVVQSGTRPMQLTIEDLRPDPESSDYFLLETTSELGRPFRVEFSLTDGLWTSRPWWHPTRSSTPGQEREVFRIRKNQLLEFLRLAQE